MWASKNCELQWNFYFNMKYLLVIMPVDITEFINMQAQAENLNWVLSFFSPAIFCESCRDNMILHGKIARLIRSHRYHVVVHKWKNDLGKNGIKWNFSENANLVSRKVCGNLVRVTKKRHCKQKTLIILGHRVTEQGSDNSHLDSHDRRAFFSGVEIERAKSWRGFTHL